MPLTAKLHIKTSRRGERTILQNTFCTQPFKLADITEGREGGVLRLMLMSSSPGILDGDEYEMNIEIGAGCRVAIETQSYQRLFHMQHGATQQLTILLEKESMLCYLPHPVVPHQRSRFHSKTKVFLHEGSSLIWGEVISCGRKLNGEVFQFSLYHSLTEVYRNGKLVVKENLLLKPAETNLAAIGQLEGFTHQATLLFIDENAAVESLIETLVGLLKKEENITFGASVLPVTGLVVRILGYKAEQLFALLKTIATLLQNAKEGVAKLKETHVA